MLDIDKIRELIPHSGRMCLLDGVLDYDDAHVICRAVSHTSCDNPLRMKGRLSAVHSIEYAGQAMAVHGALCGMGNRIGYVIALRDIEMRIAWLDEIACSLLVTVTLLAQNDTAASYRFLVEAQSRALVSGELTVAFAR